MIYRNFKDIKLSCLGMGNMRLPLTDPDDAHSDIDYEKAHEIIDYAYEHGVNYFDTAYVYNGGKSEKCLGACMKKHDRDSFYIATKFNIGANPDYKAVFAEQLERLQTDHIDFYLMHCLMDSNIDKYLESGAIEYFQELKKKGQIRYLGFSSHAGVETLKKFADAADWDFAQLQINYYDWLVSSTKEEYRVLEERNIPVMVMEPVRGGRLAELLGGADDILKAAHPEWSTVSWAFRFVQTLPQVKVILSGMSTIDQVRENVKLFEEAAPLSAADTDTVMKAAEVMSRYVAVPCTGCRYCVDDCPVKINIPEFMKLYNKYRIDGPYSLFDGMKIES
ncbi:MAG: aldo/keto reductase, partial [Parasporobacterium sp.]|nr:aldo/keto reductase [Parasporobacterium sp.]